jgi:hypothetical protein
LLAARDLSLQDLSNVTATLDGRPLDLRFAKTGVYTMLIEKGSLLNTDPDSPPERTESRIAIAARMVPMPPSGRHARTQTARFVTLPDPVPVPFTATFPITGVDNDGDDYDGERQGE